MIEFERQDGHHEIWYDSADLAKYLRIVNPQTGKPCGRNKLLEVLRFNGMIMSDSNQPSQYLVTLNLARWHMVNRRFKRYGMILFHERALEYFRQRIVNGKIQIGFKKRVVKQPHIVRLEDIC